MAKREAVTEVRCLEIRPFTSGEMLQCYVGRISGLQMEYVAGCFLRILLS